MPTSSQMPKAKSRIKSDRFLSKDNLFAYGLLTPALLVLILILIFPLIYSLILSLFRFDMLHPYQNGFIGLTNYWKILNDSTARQSLLLTLYFAGCTVLLEVFFGTIFALFLNVSFWGNRICRTLILIPIMVSEVVAALSWRLLYNSDLGLLNYLLSLFGIAKQIWLGPQFAMFSVMLVEIWQHTPFVTLIVLAGLQSLPKDTLEASTVDGASGWRQFQDIVLPLLKPIIMVAAVFRTMFTLRVFTPVWVLTAGGPSDKTLVVGVDIYRTAFRYYQFGEAAALSWLLVIMTIVITIIYMRLFKREAIS